MLLSEQIRALFDPASGIEVLATPATLDAAFDARIRYPTRGWGAQVRSECRPDLIRSLICAGSAVNSQVL